MNDKNPITFVLHECDRILNSNEEKMFMGVAKMYTVKDVAKLLDITEHTVRFYTDKGLVPSVQRDKNNIRLFDQESINWLTGVKYLKQCGMTVEDIKPT